MRRLLLAIALGLALYLGWEAWRWPDVRALARRPPATTAFIELSRARVQAEGRGGRVAWTWVEYARISPHLERAVIVAEDINFFSHRGFDTGAIRDALREALGERQPPRGASTITQQVAKNLWLTPDRTPLRKLREAILTWQLERTLTKHRILQIYLNVAEFGPGVHGAEAASRRYFRKPAAQLTEDEAARLAASLPRPATWNPAAPSRAYELYAQSILRRMARAEFLWRVI
jgi:monofunctional biosynthetic peptidoglycan transglycosylase